MADECSRCGNIPDTLIEFHKRRLCGFCYFKVFEILFLKLKNKREFKKLKDDFNFISSEEIGWILKEQSQKNRKFFEEIMK